MLPRVRADHCYSATLAAQAAFAGHLCQEATAEYENAYEGLLRDARENMETMDDHMDLKLNLAEATRPFIF